ncbi:hypothetical protein BGX24_000198 [Mortierella sp. AD032]|nr:hypothetical protein BGX24_000198 [Mortierella sp. AD032]
MAAEKLYQSFRIQPQNRVIGIQAHFHKESNQLEPKCIEYHHDEVLDLHLGDGFFPETAYSTSEQMDRDSDSSFSHSRVDSTSSSCSTADSMLPSPSTHARTFEGSSYLQPLPEIITPSHTQGQIEHNKLNLEHMYQVQRTRHFRSSSYPGQSHQPVAPAAQPVGRLRRAVSTATRTHRVGAFDQKGSLDFPPWQDNGLSSPDSRATHIGDAIMSLNLSSTPQHTIHRRYATQDGISTHPSDFNRSHPSLTLELSTPLLTLNTAVARSERPDSIVHSEEFLQRLDSTVQRYGSLLAQGQDEQARLVKIESESIKQEMAQYHDSLHSEIIKNTALQIQLQETMSAAEKMTKRILELQEDNHKQVMEKLATIQSKATAILIQNYELHEFPIPRLFIVLPKGDITTTREKIGTLFVDRFRLHFLCECGQHTRPVTGPPSSLSHDIHLARHDGYDLDRPNEFFSKYGSYVLALMQVLKYGVVVAGMVVPALNTLKVAEELEHVAAGLKVVQKDFGPKVDSAIEYLQRLTKAHEGQSKNVGNASSTATMAESTTLSRLEGLEGADLRNLGSFLKGTDKDMILGNLYRTVTPEGHVKWVCLDHYRESYGAAAVENFVETVKEFGGAYDQQTGRVAIRLVSADQARRFYITLSSARLVHELELSLDWNSSFDDLRILKDVVQQSSISHLVLDLCAKTSPMRDGFFLSHRSEPIIQIMAGPKIRTVFLRNITSFLSPTKDLFKSTTLQIRHFDLSEKIILADDFVRLENMIRASIALVRLAIVVDDIDKAYERLRLVAAVHETFSILDLNSPDGSAATFQFEQGSAKILNIGLKVANLNPIDPMRRPVLTSIELLAKNSLLPCSLYLESIIKNCRNLKRIKVGQLPDGGADLLRALQRAIDEYVCPMEVSSAVVKQGAGLAVVDEDRASDLPKTMTGFMKLHSIHNRTVLWKMSLLVASTEGSKSQKDSAMASDAETRRTISSFSVRREDRSVASVQFELEDDVSNSVVMHIGDFDTSKVFEQSSPTALALVGGSSVDRFKELSKYLTIHLTSLRISEIECPAGNYLGILQHVQQATAQLSTFTQLNLWNINDKTSKVLGLPLRNLDLLDHPLSAEQLPSLQDLLLTTPTLSRLALLTSSVLETFKALKTAALLHKQLAFAQIDGGASKMSVQFVVGVGDVHSVDLIINASEMDLLLSLPMVTKLYLASWADEPQITETASSIFSRHQQLRTFETRYRIGELMETIEAFHQGASEISTTCRLILHEMDYSLCRATTVLELPLRTVKTLDLTPSAVDETRIEILERLVRASPFLQELHLSVISINVAQQVFDFIFHERRPVAALSLKLLDGRTTAFSFEGGQGGVLSTVVQMLSQAKADDNFFMPAVMPTRVDIVGDDISKAQAAEIAFGVFCRYKDVVSIRFSNLPHQVQDIVAIIKGSVIRGAKKGVHEVRERTGDNDNNSNISMHSIDKGGGVGQASLAWYEACGVGALNERLTASDQGYATSIMRIHPDGELEAIELDCSTPDGMTLRLHPKAFNKSHLAGLRKVTELGISVGHETTLIDNLIRTPVETFKCLKVLELSCLSCQHLSVLLAVLTTTAPLVAFEKFTITHPDQSSQGVTYRLPLKSLYLRQFTILSGDYPILGSILSACPSISVLAIKVSSLPRDFKDACSSINILSSLTQFDLYDETEAMASVLFKPGTGDISSVLLEVDENLELMLTSDVPVLTMMYFSDSTLELLRVMQDATIDNLDLRSLTLKDITYSARMDLEIPFRKLDLGKQPMLLEDIQVLQRIMLASPLLTQLQIVLKSADDVHEVIDLVKAVFSKFRRLKVFSLGLGDHTEVSIRFSDGGNGDDSGDSEDGDGVGSIALCISEEPVTTLVDVSKVKKVTIRPKDVSRWLDAKQSVNGSFNIIQLYPNTETIELDFAIGSPLIHLIVFQAMLQENSSIPFRRFRHRTTETGHALITYDLPLRKLDFGEHLVDWNEFPSLEKLVDMSELLSELTMTIAASTFIDPVHEGLRPMFESQRQLNILTLKALDGYIASIRFDESGNSETNQEAPRKILSVHLQVCGFEQFTSFAYNKITRLTILLRPDGDSSDNNLYGDKGTDIFAALSEPDGELSALTHLTIQCPIDEFIGLLPRILCLRTLQQFNILDPVNFGTTISTKISDGFYVATVYLDKVADQYLFSALNTIFPGYLWTVNILQQQGKVPSISIQMHRYAEECGPRNKLRQVNWDTCNVSPHRVFALMHRFISSHRDYSQQLCQLEWRTKTEWDNQDTVDTDKGTQRMRPQPSQVLENDETATILAKLIVRGATRFEIEYDGMMALMPFVQAELARGGIGMSKPFSNLRHYNIEGVDDTTRADFLKFKGLIPTRAKGVYRGPDHFAWLVGGAQGSG